MVFFISAATSEEAAAMRRVILELQNGAEIAGEFVEEIPGRYQQIFVDGTLSIRITEPGVVIKKGFADVIFFAKADIKKMYEANLESQLK